MLSGKIVVVGVCGGIAAYKSADLISKLKKLNAEVHVIMTASAEEFIKPLTFQSLSQNYVTRDMFGEPKTWDIEHISLAKKADIIVVIPATANIIGKVANGIADDSLTSTIMAAKCPVIFAPAMNTNMYSNPIVQKNIGVLKSYNYKFVDPQCGRLACGDVGTGKLADTDDILDYIIDSISFEKDLMGLNVLVTAGPTREAIDPVRFISNYSSGKMGYSIARAAKYRGADVTLISGPVSIKAVNGINIIKINSAQEMYEAVMNNYEQAHIIIKAAAVSDFSPEQVFEHKIKKNDDISICDDASSGKAISINFKKNPDILKELGRRIKKQVLVGFAMETEDLEANAKEKLKNKNLDFIVANDLSQTGAGFSVDTNIVKIISRTGDIESIPLMLKDKLSHVILDRAVRVYRDKEQGVD